MQVEVHPAVNRRGADVIGQVSREGPREGDRTGGVDQAGRREPVTPAQVRRGDGSCVQSPRATQWTRTGRRGAAGKTITKPARVFSVIHSRPPGSAGHSTLTR